MAVSDSLARLCERLLRHGAQQLGATLQVAKEYIELSLNTHAHAGQHQRHQGRQRQFALPGERRRVFRMPGGLKEFGGPQTRGKVHKKCCKGRGNQ